MGSINLRTKILLVMIGIILLLNIPLMIFVKTALENKLFLKLQNWGLSIARHIEDMSVTPVMTKKFSELEKMVRDFKGSDDDIYYIFILDNNGVILAHTFEKWVPVALKSANLIGSGQTHSVQLLKVEEKNIKKDILDIAVPILGGEAGVVHIGISQDHMRRDVNEIVMVMIWMITAIMMAGIFAAVALSRAITRPVSELIKAVRIAGSGKLDHVVQVSTNDEIGQLADSFNKMTNDLKRREDELEMINSELTVLQIISAIAADAKSLEDLFKDVLAAVTNQEILKIAQNAVIFIIDGERMNLVSQAGVTEDFANAHKGMKIGECICGLSAETGKIIVSESSDTDKRHTIKYPGMIPHGHISIPLAARNKVLGILCLFSLPGTEITDRKKALFYTIGSRIGAAIDNIILYQETKELSLHDPLTGLANRRLMDYVLETSYGRAKRAECPFSAIMLDIDFFKKYNDEYGHAFGDKMLVDIAKIISKEIRQVDLGVRYGGEEFLILLPETGLSEACDVAERIRKDVETKTGITISLGVSCYDHWMQKKEDIVHKADDALLRAKQKGRNRIEVNA